VASYCGRCLLCRVGDPVGCIDYNCATAITASPNHRRGGAVAAAAVVVLDWMRPRLALLRKNKGTSDTGLTRISASNNFPQVVLLIVGSATCAAHIALGIVEDHARVFHSEEIGETCLVVACRPLKTAFISFLCALQALQHGWPAPFPCLVCWLGSNLGCLSG